MTRTLWPKDALIPDLARGCCHRFRRGPASNSATGSNINDSFWVSGCRRLPFTSHKSWQASEGLQAPDWLPKGVRQGRGAPRGSSQGLNYTDQVLLLAVGVSAGERDIVKVFPEKVIKLKVALSCFLYYRD